MPGVSSSISSVASLTARMVVKCFISALARVSPMPGMDVSVVEMVAFLRCGRC